MQGAQMIRNKQDLEVATLEWTRLSLQNIAHFALAELLARNEAIFDDLAVRDIVVALSRRNAGHGHMAHATPPCKTCATAPTITLSKSTPRYLALED